MHTDQLNESNCRARLARVSLLLVLIIVGSLSAATIVCRQNISDIWFGDKRVCGSSGLEVQAAIAC